MTEDVVRTRRELARVLFGRKRSGKLPRRFPRMRPVLVPRRVEAQLENDLERAVLPLAELVRDRVLPLLRRVHADSVVTRADAAPEDPDAGDISRVIDDLVIVFGTELEITKPLKRAAKDTADHTGQQHKRNVAAVLGVRPDLAEPWLADETKRFVDANVKLIKSVGVRYFAGLEAEIKDAFDRGLKHPELAERIEKRFVEVDGLPFTVAKRRARLIARDQVGKLTGQLTERRQTALGIERYIWRTSRDERVRQSHREREGKSFRWDKPIEPQLEAYGLTPDPIDGHVGIPIQCRCTAEPDVLGMLDALEREGGQEPDREQGPEPEPERKLAPEPFTGGPVRVPFKGGPRPRPVPPPPPPRPPDGTATPGDTRWHPPGYADQAKALGLDLTRFDTDQLKSGTKRLMRSKQDGPAQAQVRGQLASLVDRYRLVDREVLAGASRASRFLVKERMPQSASGFREWSGSVHLSGDVSKALVKYADGDRGRPAQYAIKVAIHEQLHGASPLKASAYKREGRLIEEVSTEVAARKIHREASSDHTPIPVRRDQGAAVLLQSYQPWIDDVLFAHSRVPELGTLTPDEHVSLLERASFAFKAGTTRDVDTPDEANKRWASAVVEAAGLKGQDATTAQIALWRELSSARDRRVKAGDTELR